MKKQDIIGYAVFVAFSSTPDPHEFADYAILGITREWLEIILKRQRISADIGHAVIFEEDHPYQIIFFRAEYGTELPAWQKFLMLEEVSDKENELIVIPKEYGDRIVERIEDYSEKKPYDNQMIAYPDGKIQWQCWLPYAGIETCSHVSVSTRHSKIIDIFFDEDDDYRLLFTPDLAAYPGI